MLIEEMYYESHLIPHFTSRMIFYGLKFMNGLNLDISRIRSEFQPGLEVNFRSQVQIEELLRNYGTVEMIRNHPWTLKHNYPRIPDRPPHAMTALPHKSLTQFL